MAGILSETAGGGHAAVRAAIEFFDRGARIAVLQRGKTRPTVADLIEVEFPAPPEGQIVPPAAKAAALRDALRSHGWKLRTMTLVLPKNVVTLRLVMLPSTHDDELAEMARFEAQKHIPFNVERHVISHAVLRKEGVEGSLVLIAAVDRAALEDPMAVCREARIELSAARVSSLALAEALLLDPPAGYAEQTYALVNLGWSTIDITIISNGIVRFTRSGTMGVSRIAPVLEEVLGSRAALTRERLGSLDALSPEAFFERKGRPRRRPVSTTYNVDDFLEEESEPAIPSTTAAAGEQVEEVAAAPTGPAAEVVNWLNRIVQEIQRTQAFAAREFDCPDVGAVYLAGLGSYIANMDKYLEQAMRCPVALIQIPATLDFATPKNRDLRGAWREFAVVGGAIAGTAMPPVNLLPPEYTEGLARRKRRRSLAFSGILLLLLVMLSGAFAARWANNQRRDLEYLQKRNKNLAPKVKELSDKQRRLDIVKDVVEDPRSAGAVLEAICKIDMVAKRIIALTEYHYIKGKGVILTGHAVGNPAAGSFGAAEVENFRAALEKTGIFKGGITIKSRSPFRLPGNRPEVQKFEFDCVFLKEAAK
ncbi:MAG: pilus assembly protein PilM [Candidatus Sumerlaeia bacterium]|nr:pilus assembly protein PilM [Candidatus Sumerlaeia bacterium]